jgi:endonuclease-3
MPDIHAIHNILKSLYPDAVCSLEWDGDPWRLLVAARLSAQCTDERVNIVCVPLFEKFPDVHAFAEAEVSEIEEIIRPCGLYHTKAQSISEAAKIIIQKHGGRVPDTMEELLKLPGVGRKTANLLLGDLYGKPSVVCDTHVIRISNRLGLAKGKEPEKVEVQLRSILPPEESSDFCHRIVLFGRDLCTARSPRCGECPLRPFCKEFRG